MVTCARVGCPAPPRLRGVCQAHYGATLRSGTRTRWGRKPPTIADRRLDAVINARYGLEQEETS